jgi:predicted signal transduction protein with EAL and GGDEF domain
MSAWGIQYDRPPTAPAFFDSLLSVVLILVFVTLSIALWSVHSEHERLGPRATVGWVAVILIGGPIGVIAWYLIGRGSGDGAPTQSPSPYS